MPRGNVMRNVRTETRCANRVSAASGHGPPSAPFLSVLDPLEALGKRG